MKKARPPKHGKEASAVEDSTVPGLTFRWQRPDGANWEIHVVHTVSQLFAAKLSGFRDKKTVARIANRTLATADWSADDIVADESHLCALDAFTKEANKTE